MAIQNSLNYNNKINILYFTKKHCNTIVCKTGSIFGINKRSMMTFSHIFRRTNYKLTIPTNIFISTTKNTVWNSFLHREITTSHNVSPRIRMEINQGLLNKNNKKEIVLSNSDKNNTQSLITSDDFKLTWQSKDITLQISGLRTYDHFLGSHMTQEFRKWFVVEILRVTYNIFYDARSLRDILCNIAKTLKYFDNQYEIEDHLKLIFGWPGKMSMNQHIITALFGDIRIPKTLLEEIGEGLVNFSTVAYDVHSLSILEIFTLFEVIPKEFLLKNKANLQIISIDPRNISLCLPYNEELAEKQTKQVHPDFLFISKPLENEPEIHFYKDVKTADKHALTHGHIVSAPGISENFKSAQKYVNKYFTDVRGHIASGKLTEKEKKAFENLAADLKKYRDLIHKESKGDQLKTILENCNSALLNVMFTKEFKNVNFSISKDPGTDDNFKQIYNKDFKDLVDKNHSDIDINAFLSKNATINVKNVEEIFTNLINKCAPKGLGENMKTGFNVLKEIREQALAKIDNVDNHEI